MAKKKASRIPKFKTIAEEAEFWDTHDITDFEDEAEEVEIVFDLDQPRDATLVLRVQKKVKDELTKLARRKGLNVSSLARMWLLEKLESRRAGQGYAVRDGEFELG